MKFTNRVLILATLATSLFMATTAVSAKTDLNIATGSEGGKYEYAGKLIGNKLNAMGRKKGIEFDVNIINTNGSKENIELFNDGDANVIIVQADALNVYPPSTVFKAKRAHTEYIFWVYNTKLGYTDLEDIEGKSKKAGLVIVEGSGAEVTMSNFVIEDSGYADTLKNVTYADDLYDAADMVCEGRSGSQKLAGFLYVGGRLPAEIRNEFKGCISVGEATDGDFNDAEDVNGEELYTKCKIPTAKYSPLSSSNSFTDVSTICVKAMVVYSTDFGDSKVNKLVKKGISKVVRKLK